MRNLIRLLVLVLALLAFGASAVSPSTSTNHFDCGPCCEGQNGEDLHACLKYCEDSCRLHVCPVCRK